MNLIRLTIIILTAVFLLSLTACLDKMSILIIPKQGDYFAGVISYGNWAGKGGTVTLFDKNNNAQACEGKYSRVKDAVGCSGRKFHAVITCTNGRTAELNFATKSCTEAYGIAVDDLGNAYEVYIGISDKMIKTKIAEYEEAMK